MNWFLLGIEQTNDTDVIKKAYRARLKETNPEEKPEEFKALRAAYEEALQYAKEHAEGEEETALTPEEDWKKRLNNIYEDFRKRIDENEWKKLFEDDLCISLDTRGEMEETLLRFLMDHFFLPQKIWQLMDKEFRFEERRDELAEKFPSDFLEFAVIGGIRYPALLPVEMYVPGVNGAACEEYNALYRKMREAEGADQMAMIEKLRTMPESHPYAEAGILRIVGKAGDEETIASLKALCDRYPGDTSLIESLAGAYLDAEMYDECIEVCKDIKDNMNIDWLRAQSLAGLKNYEDAISTLSDMISRSDHNPGQSNYLAGVRAEWSKAYKEQLLAKYEENPDDAENILSLAWSYLLYDDLKEAAKWGEKLSPETIHPIDYYHFTSIVEIGLGKNEEGAVSTQKQLDLIEALSPEDSYYPKWSKRLPEVYSRLARCNEDLGNRDEAVVLYEKALAKNPSDGFSRASLCALMLREKNYPGLLENARKMLQIEPRNQTGLYFNCLALVEMHREQEAFDALNTALQVNPTSLDLYFLKGKVLIRNHAFEQARAMLDYLKENEAGDFADVKTLEAYLLEEQNPDSEDENIRAELLKRYGEILDMADAGEHVAEPAEISYRMACIAGSEKEPNVKKVRMHLEKGLSFDKEHFNCLSYKAWLLKRENKTKEALEIYHALEKLKRNNLYIEGQLAECYYADLTDSADKAYRYYEMLNNADETPDHLFHLGVCGQYLQENEKTLEVFKRLGEVDPNGVDSPYRCSKVLAAMGRWEEAMDYIEKAIAVPDENKKDPTAMHYYKVILLRRKERYDEAQAYLEKIIKDYPDFENPFSERASLLLGSGKMTEYEKFLQNWKKAGTEKAAYYSHYLKLCYLQEDKQEIKHLLTWRQRDLSERNKADAKRFLCSLDGDMSGLVKMYAEELNRAKAKGDWDKDYEQEMLHLMWAQYMAGKKSEAVKLAEEIYTVQQKKMERFSLDKALTYSRGIEVLAILGRVDEARELLAKVRSMPLCQYCAYHSCKDSDIYEVRVLIAEGRFEEAQAMAAECLKKWPDEEDFKELILYLQKRSKIK